MSEPEVWAIGGGKGGTGKSFFTSSAGLSLAASGKKVILIDADLGGANLHSFLGVKRPQKTLTDFFEKKTPLSDLIVKPDIDNVGLITGDLQSMDSDSVKYTQKLKLFRHIRTLKADYVLIDLGAGTHNNTLDTFLLADKTIVVIMPDVTAIENLYHFIKNAYFRKLKICLGHKGMKDLVTQKWRNRQHHDIENLRQLVEHLSETSPEIQEILKKEHSEFNINIVMNQTWNNSDIKLGAQVRSVVRKFLSIQADYSGFMSFDDTVINCLNRGNPFMKAYPSSPCAREVESTTFNIVHGRQHREGKA